MATSITKPELKQIIKEEILRLSKISTLEQKQTQLLKELNECGCAMENDIDEGMGDWLKNQGKNIGIIKRAPEELEQIGLKQIMNDPKKKNKYSILKLRSPAKAKLYSLFVAENPDIDGSYIEWNNVEQKFVDVNKSALSYR